MEKFVNVRLSHKEKITEGEYKDKHFLFFCDENDNDWYTVRDKWASQGKALVGVDPLKGNLVCAFEKDPTRWTTVEGQTIYAIPAKEVDNVPDGVVAGYTFDGVKFNPVIQAVPVRTKEDILADLQKLQAELTNM